MSETRQKSFHAWYERNAEEFNARRRTKYHLDPEIRAKARMQAAEYRKKRGMTSVPTRQRGDLYTTTRVATLLRVTAQTVRNWEARNIIPTATHGGKHRLYTAHQVMLLQQWSRAVSRVAVEHAREKMFSEWSL